MALVAGLRTADGSSCPSSSRGLPFVTCGIPASCSISSSATLLPPSFRSFRQASSGSWTCEVPSLIRHSGAALFELANKPRVSTQPNLNGENRGRCSRLACCRGPLYAPSSSSGLFSFSVCFLRSNAAILASPRDEQVFMLTLLTVKQGPIHGFGGRNSRLGGLLRPGTIAKTISKARRPRSVK